MRYFKRSAIPIIAYLKYKGDDHFSVIRGFGPDGMVWLGDPSWGNRKFSAVRVLLQLLIYLGREQTRGLLDYFGKQISTEAPSLSYFGR
jgi:hypothetical protein